MSPCVVRGCRWETSALPYTITLEVTDLDGAAGDWYDIDLDVEACPEHGRELVVAAKAIAVASSRLAVDLRDRRALVDAEEDLDFEELLSDEFYDDVMVESEDEFEREMEELAYSTETEDPC